MRIECAYILLIELRWIWIAERVAKGVLHMCAAYRIVCLCSEKLRACACKKCCLNCLLGKNFERIFIVHFYKSILFSVAFMICVLLPHKHRYYIIFGKIPAFSWLAMLQRYVRINRYGWATKPKYYIFYSCINNWWIFPKWISSRQMTILSLQYFINIFVRFCDSKPLQLNMLREITKSYLLKLYIYKFFYGFCAFFVVFS